ncbi:penicillin acylase family protein [Conexibacter sp. DBS9H8]|uniref:penicillin acylase family protein n=1 Tax=Conexibacter sp. DBS9H8 TaxID=2937801 RepID=UPI00200C197C|nr:penicillin acylase family protein [Conexibacter sp. DBS9H8]
MRRVALSWSAALALAATVAFVPAAAAATTPPLPSYVQAYGAGTVPGFYNILPPGENGADNIAQYLAYKATGQRPANSVDQLPLYENLLYAAPTLTDSQVPNYFLNATFGVPSADITRVEQPIPGVTIIHDQYDIPHIYGATRGDVMFGAGYAAAEDRLFLMDVLRHTAEATLSSFLGGGAGNEAMDAAQWTVAPYTPADLQRQVNDLPRLRGAAGAELVDDIGNYVDGINAYIAKIRSDPTLLPFEYSAINQTPQPWQATDVVAISSLIGAIFGKGGGNQVNSALTEEAFVHRFGTRVGRTVWANFREANDPQAPTTVSHPFPYQTNSPFSPSGLAMPVPGSVRYVSPGQTNPANAQIRRAQPAARTATARSAAAVNVATTAPGTLGKTDTPNPVPIPTGNSLGSALLENFYGQKALASNWELVNAAHSADGHAIAVMGPQVGYYAPQILMDEDLHGPGIDANGASFPGVNLYVELGHGNDYAWSATTGTTDNVSTFAEVLCHPGGGRPSPNSIDYYWHGRCRAMQKLVRTNTWTPNLEDPTPKGSETLVTYRTVHGLVFARGEVTVPSCHAVRVPTVDCISRHRIAVAFVSARTTYMHEVDSAIGFSQFNNPADMQTPQAFKRAAANISFGFNWAYVNAKHIAYFESGAYPEWSTKSSPDFPILGNGPYDWSHFNAASFTERDVPASGHPQAIDPTFEVSWNNKQAPKWSAADDNYGYGAVYRSQLISAHIQADLAHGHKVDIAQLVQSMEFAATEDIRIVKLWPLLRQVIGRPRSPALARAVSELNAWYAAGGHRWDLNPADTNLTVSGSDANTPAIELMDAWWPKLLSAEFLPRLSRPVFDDLRGMLNFGSVYTGTAPNEPDMAQGWFSYVYKDMEDLLAAHRNAQLRAHGHRGRVHVPGAYAKIFCGNGSFNACRAALDASLLTAMSVTPKSMYGYGICAKNPQPSCFDQDQSTEVSAIPVTPFPFQNRPTFQQVVELTQTLPPSASGG